MTTRRSKPSDSKPDAQPERQPLLTSNDLFGDLVDEPLPPSPGRPGARKQPIRVQLKDPSQPPRMPPGDAAEIAAVLSRLDDPEAEASGSKAKAAGGDTDAVVEAALPPAPDLDPAALAGERTSSQSFAGPIAQGTRAPVIFGPYTLVERVAAGGMAEVFKAKRSGVEGFEKILALKRILPHLSDNKEFVNMFVDEAKMVAGLNHPNIVQIYDLGKIEHSYYIAMEYVQGRDLRTIEKRAQEKGLRMPLDLGLRIVSQVCAALEYAHRKKDERGHAMEIVHRDVSPQNILISFDGDVKLADFGIAKAATKASGSEPGALRGKLLYMSPEQAWGRPLDRRCDVFSLGIVLYELVTETKPFVAAGGELTILERVRQCLITPPREVNPRVPDALDRVIMKALTREPDERYQDAGQMQRGLERFLRERPPVTARDLARFLELLFDRGEREGAAEGPQAVKSDPRRGAP